jgi:hypothetical protein
MDPITISLIVAKIASGIFGSRAAKRQSQSKMLQASIVSNLAQAKAFGGATSGYGGALVAANRSGGFSPNAFSTSWNNVAADFRQIGFNRMAQEQQALATASAGRMSLLNSSTGALFDVATDYLGSHKTSPAASYRPTPNLQSKFIDQEWFSQMASPFGQAANWGGY